MEMNAVLAVSAVNSVDDTAHSSLTPMDDAPHSQSQSLPSFSLSSSSLSITDFAVEPASPLDTLAIRKHLDHRHHSGGGDASCFFADATLDLAEAHDIAETPEPKQMILLLADAKNAKAMELPDLLVPPLPNATITSTNNNNNNNSNTNGSMRLASDPLAQPTIEPRSLSLSSPNQNRQSSSNSRVTNFMNRITSADANAKNSETPSSNNSTTIPTYRPRLPRRPRDLAWAIAWVFLVPLSLFYCSSLPNETLPNSAQLAMFYSILLAYFATIGLARMLYRTLGGGEGDNARHVSAHILLAFAPLSVTIPPLSVLVLYFKTPTAARAWMWIPILWSISNFAAALRNRQRHLFFAALTCMALDILSRSLRRSSFYRMVSLLVGLQLCMVVWWKWALVGAWGATSHYFGLRLFVALVAGKWATGTVARTLGFMASGGIASWFAQQSQMMQDMEEKKRSQQLDNTTVPIHNSQQQHQQDDASYDSEHGYSSNYMPEAYRSADASAYRSVLDMDDEDEDDDDEDELDESPRRPTNHQMDWTSSNTTPKAFLFSAVTVSFGSVAQCGLLGGLAQVVWSIVRNVDAAKAVMSQRFPTSRLGFRGMAIETTDGILNPRPTVTRCWKLVNQASVTARTFVRSHSDLAMCHVAAYYKSYQRAANDVAILVDGSGVEPIIHDDITTHMCACVCGSISGVIVMFIGTVLCHNRSPDITDDVIVKSMFLSFILCYTLLFTVMEPLRASIKAIYVCFAQHPQSLSQAFPLIYHRLSRISEANLV